MVRLVIGSIINQKANVCIKISRNWGEGYPRCQKRSSKAAASEADKDPARVLFQEGGSRQWCQTLLRCYLRGWTWIDHWICNMEIIQQTHRNLVRSFDLNNICRKWCLQFAHTLFSIYPLSFSKVWSLWSQFSHSACPLFSLQGGNHAWVSFRHTLSSLLLLTAMLHSFGAVLLPLLTAWSYSFSPFSSTVDGTQG